MRPISTKMHGYLDYTVGVVEIVGPALLGYKYNNAAVLIPCLLGIFTIIYSLFTNYELGLYRYIPMKTHLGLDILSAITLFVIPYLGEFSKGLSGACIIVSVFEIIVVALSRREVESRTESKKRAFYNSGG